MKRGKKYVEAAKLIDRATLYDRDEAIALVKKSATAKFDETIEAHIRTGCDGRHADQQIRGMNDIASKLGVTKAALYKHYKSKQEILDSIIEKMNELDIARVKQYEMPEGNLEKVTAEYKETAFDKIKQFTKVQFLHWTEEEFSSCFRKMLTLEQYREPQMAQLYQNYLASGPLTYMEALFSGMLGDEGKARQTALDFYGPIFLLYSIYDGAEDKSQVIKLLEEHMDHFLQEMQIS